jgi:hypothetical protein
MRYLLLLFCASLAGATSMIFIGTPTSAYTSQTTLLNIGEPEGDIVSSISDPLLTVSFLYGGASTLEDVDAVPDSWSTWGSPPDTESSTPMVLAPDDPTQTDLVFQFSSDLTEFGMELEPDDTTPGNMHTITMTFLQGANVVGTLQQSVSGDAGAMLFAGMGGPFDSVEVASDVDFAAAEFRYTEAQTTATPESSTGLLTLGAMGLLAVLRARRVSACQSERNSPVPGSVLRAACGCPLGPAQKQSVPILSRDRKGAVAPSPFHDIRMSESCPTATARPSRESRNSGAR